MRFPVRRASLARPFCPPPHSKPDEVRERDEDFLDNRIELLAEVELGSWMKAIFAVIA